MRTTWEQATQTSIQKWDQLADLLAEQDLEGFRRHLLEGCGMCAKAQEDVDALGPPKVQLYRCDFCRGYLDHGGCQDALETVVQALDAGDLAGVRNEVDRVREMLRRILPAMREA